VGYIDANNPPECKSLNSDANIPLIKSERLQFFVKALRRCAKAWLDQLTARVRPRFVDLDCPQNTWLPTAPFSWRKTLQTMPSCMRPCRC
jgi:hypothetical protein